MDAGSLPFEVGQLVEMRSFLAGYRGAWFRCKIKDIGRRKKQLGHALEYIDFPDEKICWTKLYQKGSNSKDGKRTLMVRPCFPSVYRESQMPDFNTISEVVVIVNDVWKVGDLVDWWTDNCFWSGMITEKLGDDKVKFELPPPPVGEGYSYEVFCKDLRPSLDWSVGEGWKLLFPKENKYQLPCARMVKPLNQGLNIVHHVPRKISCSNGVSSSLIQDTSAQMPETAVQKDKSDYSGSSKKLKVDQSICLNSTSSDTMEAAVLDLEELICRVKWLKHKLEFETPLSDTLKSWKFIEHRGLSTPK
ncbi:hypothetical protein REPUB_Repub20aG0096700 [Reevesia pubescens]